MWSTSTGRILDAGASILGVCQERTYEGEPAMKLETLARGGRNLLEIHPVIKYGTLETEQLLHWVFQNRNRVKKKDLAYSMHAYLARGLGQIAIDGAETNASKSIGFSGGVAFNGIINYEIRKFVEKEGYKFLTNREVPPGDGGLSFGQAIAASLWRKT
jgi:hydrogenase maturation protein HypF